MRKVYAVSGGVSQIAIACPDKTFQTIIKEAFDYALRDLRLTIEQFLETGRWLGRIGFLRSLFLAADGRDHGSGFSGFVPEVHTSKGDETLISLPHNWTGHQLAYFDLGPTYEYS